MGSNESMEGNRCAEQRRTSRASSALMTPLLLLRSFTTWLQSSLSASISPFGGLFCIGLGGMEAEKLRLGVECADCSGVAMYALISKSLKFEFTGELVLLEGEKSK